MLVVAGRPEKLCGFPSDSVTVGADTNAHTGSSETDASAPLFIVPAALEMTLVTSVSIGITGITDDDAALSAFTPATAVFIADHADVLNVVRRPD
jgi:hypothetical protein